MNRRHAFAAAVLATTTVCLATACGSSHSSASAPASGTKASTTTGPATPSTSARPPRGPAGSRPSPAASTAVPAVAPTAAVKAASPAKAASPVRTQTLPDGSKAKVYKLGDQHYRAKIVHSGEVLATLETNGQDAGLDANDMFIVLTLDGQVHSWMGGGHQGPGTFKLPGGWTAKVTKLGELRYRAQILGNEGEVDATMETNQHDVGLDANAVYIVLDAGGVISAHQ